MKICKRTSEDDAVPAGKKVEWMSLKCRESHGMRAPSTATKGRVWRRGSGVKWTHIHHHESVQTHSEDEYTQQHSTENAVYGCETWSLTLREACNLRACENKMMENVRLEVLKAVRMKMLLFRVVTPCRLLGGK
jgi:hypothetical protein